MQKTDRDYIKWVLDVFSRTPFDEAMVSFEIEKECISYVNKFKYYLRTHPNIKGITVHKRNIHVRLVKEKK